MQQSQEGTQSRSHHGTSQTAQISHSASTTHVSETSTSVDRTTSQQPVSVSTPHSLSVSHSHLRPTEIAWLSHAYVDPVSQPYHPHQMHYLPSDTAQLTTVPLAQEGTRVVKRGHGSRSDLTTSSVQTGSNATSISGVSSNESGLNNVFLSYVVNPSKGVPPSGVCLFDSSRGLLRQGSQSQSSRRRDTVEDSVQSGRLSNEVGRETSSGSTGSPKACDSHFVSRSCQTVVTMSQIRDSPLLPNAKFIIMDSVTPEILPETVDTKDRVFNEADGEDSEEASTIDSENESDSLKRINRLDSARNRSEFDGQSQYSHQHVTPNCHGDQNQGSTGSANRGLSNGMEGEGVSSSVGHATMSARTNGSEIEGRANFSFVDVGPPFRCGVCGRTYTSQQAFVNHERYHRGDRPYECEVCHKAFATNYHLVTHRRTHTGERPFQCQFCQRCFADRSAFVKHERTHVSNGSSVKRHKCDECGSGFTDSCGLKKHMRIHTGERPYVCTVCSKTFSTSSTFVAHKRIHTGERPYKCESCDKMFITKSHLLTHRRTHTGEKPFICTICNRCFADGSSFRRHERLHRGENRHMCMHCGRGFPLETSLEKHKQTHVQAANFPYIFENHDELHCLSDHQQPICNPLGSRSARIPPPQETANSDQSDCVDLSQEIHGEAQVNRNSLCAVASQEGNRENPSVMVSAREVA